MSEARGKGEGGGEVYTVVYECVAHAWPRYLLFSKHPYVTASLSGKVLPLQCLSIQGPLLCGWGGLTIFPEKPPLERPVRYFHVGVGDAKVDRRYEELHTSLEAAGGCAAGGG